MSARSTIGALGLIAAIAGGAMAQDALPTIRTRADLEAHAGERARIEGRYEVSPVAGSKRLQPVVVVLSDGTQLIRHYRPHPGDFGLADKRVVIIGRATLDADAGPNVQQVMAPHVFADTIELAPGEQATDPPPTELPAPPKVTEAADFDPHAGRYVRLVGKLEQLRALPDESFWADAIYTLADGSSVQQASVPISRWKAHVGKRVTVVARAGLVEIDGTRQLLLTDLSAICEGDVERCGMPAGDLGPLQKKIGGPPKP